MAYSKTVWVNYESPYINATNLNKQEQGIYDNSLLSEQNEEDVADLRVDVDINTENILGLATGEIYQGTWTPTAPAEYPTAPEEGFSWYINDVADGGYTFAGGDLVGRVANNGDKIIYNGTAWSMVDNCNERDEYYTVDNVSSLAGISAPLENAIAMVKGYYTAGDFGGGTFIYDSTQIGTNNGGTIFAGWVRQYEGALNIRYFGALGDGITDDTIAIQNTLNQGRADKNATYIPSGDFMITAELDRSQGDYSAMDIYGDGLGSSRIVVDATLPVNINSALLLHDEGANSISGVTVRGLSILTNGKADMGIDAHTARYWNLVNVEVLDASVAGLKCGNWVTTIDRCEFRTCVIGVIIEGLTPTQISQAIVITNSSFNTCNIGIQPTFFNNDIVITNNTFDACSDAGINLIYGGREYIIERNYFESCGKVPTLTVGGAIVQNYTASEFSGVIAENMFSNNNPTRIILLGGAYYENLTIRDNCVHDNTGKSTYFVEITGIGSEFTTKNLVVRGTYNEQSVDQIVGLNGTDHRNNNCNMVIENYETAPSRKSQRLSFTDITKFESTATLIEGTYQGSKAITFDVLGDGAKRSRYADVLLDDNSPMLGSYLRVHFGATGVGGANGLRTQISLDGTIIFDYTAPDTTDTMDYSRNPSLYIPRDASGKVLRVYLIPNQSTANMIVTNFSICDASVAMEDVPYLKAF